MSSPWLLALAILIFTQCSFISSALATPGKVTPSYVEIEIGGSANITCQMNLSMFGGNDSTSMYFAVEGSKTREPDTNIAIINETTIVYMIRNATARFTNYLCKSGEHAIGLVHVSVGTPPMDVNDFKCFGYDYTYMVCNFSMPANEVLTKYNLSYSAQSPKKYPSFTHKNGTIVYRTIFPQNYIQNCKLEVNAVEAMCNLTLDNGNYRASYDFYNFTLTSKNFLGEHVQNFWINHYQSVIPPRPQFHYTLITEDSVDVTWHMTKFSYYHGLQYDISLTPENCTELTYEIRHNNSEYKLKLRDSHMTHFSCYNNRERTHENLPELEYKLHRVKTEFTLKLRNLPYAYYTYNLKLKLKLKEGTMWSEPYEQRFTTGSRPPFNPPRTDAGSFYIDSTEEHVHLYWQQLPVTRENGRNLHYVVTHVKRDGKQINHIPKRIDRISATFVWDKNHHYVFTIKSRNDEGDSPESSHIVVPRMSNGGQNGSPNWIRNVYHDHNLTYTLSWSPPTNVTNLMDYTVFWCQPQIELLTSCKDSIQFEHVSRDQTFIAKNLLDDRKLSLAVSANYKGFNSGMHWTMCSAAAASALAKLVPEVRDTSPHSITLQWRTDAVCTSLIEGYYLIYCRVENNSYGNAECSESDVNIVISKTAKNFRISNLKPFSTYQIEMKMFSKMKNGTLSDIQFMQTKEDAPTSPRNLIYRHVTSNSALLSWTPPTHFNGLIRHYTVASNNEYHTVNCTAAVDVCSEDAEQNITFKLENLSSYTDYKVYIIAHTVKDSLPSNDIHFCTLIGIPSTPKHLTVPETNRSILQWSKPAVPSGRVDFYEVTIIEWYKDQIIRQRISAVISSSVSTLTACAFTTPPCIDTYYKHTLKVRAVNVAKRSSEIDQALMANTTEDDPDAYYYDGYDDLKCVGSTPSQREQEELLSGYRKAQLYVQFKSVWQEGPIYRCAAPLNKYLTFVLILSVASMITIGTIIYFVKKKIMKMIDIKCELPPELCAPPKSGGGSVDVSLNNGTIGRDNENRRLLSSDYNDSGYLGGRATVIGGGIRGGVTSCSIGKQSSGYVGSDRSGDYSQQNLDFDESIEPAQPNGADNAYMVMEVLKSKPPIANSPNTDGYIQATELKLPAIHTDNGYIKANNIFSTLSEMPIGSTGYVQPSQMSQKPTIQPPICDGYTTLNDLGKPIINAHTHPSLHASPVHGGHPPISGYVTQKELSAFGQHRMSS